MHVKKRENVRQRKFSTKTVVLCIIVGIVFVAICIAMLPLARFLSTQEGQTYVAEKMQDFGLFAPLGFVLLQVIQVVIAVIPGGPIPIIGGMIFGESAALVLSLAGFFLGTVLVYYLVQWIGKPLVDRFVSEKQFQKFDFLTKGKRMELFIFLVFLLPGLPKDVLTYLVSFQSKIKPMRLFILTTLGRTPATILTVYMGGSIWDGNYRLLLILVGVLLLLAIVGFCIKKNVNKRAERRDSVGREKKT